MDLILCRNVLMYFVPDRAKGVIHNLYRSLVDGRWLLVSATETSQTLFPQFATINFPGASFYKKEIGKPWAMEPLSLPVPNETPALFHSPLAVVVGPEVALGKEAGGSLLVEVQAPQTGAPRSTPYVEALALHETGRYTEAAERLVGLLAGDPADPQALALMARVCANQGQLADALAWGGKAVAADRLNPGGYYLLATILEEQDRVEEAVAALRRALYLDPDFVLAYVAMGNLARRQGKVRESTRHWGNALALLGAYRQEEVLPGSDGMAAGRLVELIPSSI